MTRLSILFPVFALACSGDPFETKSAPGDGGSAGSEAPSGGGGKRASGGSGGTAASGGGTAGAGTSGAAGAEPLALCESLRSGDSPEFDREVCFPAGSYSMGSNNPNYGNGFADHTPLHEVALSEFALDAYEVTILRFRACVVDGACKLPGLDTSKGCDYSDLPTAYDNRPVTCVDYDDATTFCNWDGGRRLPTEAEWERAARGASSQLYPWGNEFACVKSVLGGAGACPEYSSAFPKVVASVGDESLEGAHDLAGNAPEWVADWVGSYGGSSKNDPAGPTMGTERVLRGGSWLSPPSQGYGYARRSSSPIVRGAWGFRCARSQ
jgi:formylglycine-generating enzyme required for sulfatase activity